jgi:hypothetical protein
VRRSQLGFSSEKSLVRACDVGALQPSVNAHIALEVAASVHFEVTAHNGIMTHNRVTIYMFLFVCHFFL